MNKVHKAIHGIFNLLFGEFNGVQTFLYPLTIFWWIDSRSFLYTITGLLTNQKHYFPLCLFFLLGMFICFLIIKNSSSIFDFSSRSNHEQKHSFFKMVIEVHKTLLFTLICISLIYLLSTFLSYYYGIKIPLKYIYPYILRGFSILLIIYYVLLNSWTKGHRNNGMDMASAVQQVKQDIIAQPSRYSLHALLLVLFIIIGSYIYNLMVESLLFPGLQVIGIVPRLILLAPMNFFAVLYDVFVFGVAFMLSNLLFSPIVIVVMHYIKAFNPGEITGHHKDVELVPTSEDSSPPDNDAIDQQP